MVSADIENAVAAQKIEIRNVIHVVEIRALGPGIDFVEADDALGRNEGAVQMPLVQFVIFTQSRCDDLFQVKSHAQRSLICAGNANAPADKKVADSKWNLRLSVRELRSLNLR